MKENECQSTLLFLGARETGGAGAIVAVASASLGTESMIPPSPTVYGTVVMGMDGDFTILAIRLEPFQNSSTRFVAAWDQLSPKAGTKYALRTPPTYLNLVVTWFITTTATSISLAILFKS